MSEKLTDIQDNKKQAWLRNAVATPTGWFDKDTREQLTHDTTLLERGATPVADWIKTEKKTEIPKKTEEKDVKEPSPRKKGK